MAGRFVPAGILFSAALAFLLVFASGGVDATTFKTQYSGSLSCAGADGVYGGGAADDSCKEHATYGARGAGLTADMVSTFNIPEADPRYSNSSMLATMGVPDTWQLATDKEIPNGAYVGSLVSQSTLALFGGECATPLTIPFPMYDCTTENFEGVNDGCPASGAAESGPKCNDSVDNDGDTKVNDGCPKVPTNDDAPDDTLVNDGCPAVGPAEGTFPSPASACWNNTDDDGDTVANDGCPQVGDRAESGAQCVDAESGASCNNATDDDGDGDPIIAWDVGLEGNNLTYGHKGDLPDGCTKYPQHLNTIMEGLTPRARYFGLSIPVASMGPSQVQFLFFSTEEESARGSLPYTDMGDSTGYINQVIVDNPLAPTVPGASLDELCTPLATSTTLLGKTSGEGELSQNVPPIPPTPFVGSFWTVPDDCGDGVDDDGDTKTDEMCFIARATNPAANTGILGTGSHLVKSYAESYRDADQDGIPNNEDECPTIVDAGTDTDGDRIDNVCDPTPGLPPEPDEDLDTYRNQQDNCPLVANVNQADTDKDAIGDACDPNVNVPNGSYLNAMPVGSVCIAAADADGDGWCDATEAALGSDLGDDEKTPESYVVDMTVRAAEDPPGAGPQTCTNYEYYDTTQSHPATPHQNGASNPVDDDGDTLVNSTGPSPDPGCTTCETPDKVNDGCGQVGGLAETSSQCDNALDDDTADGGAGRSEADISGACTNSTDDDYDGKVNDGCPAVGDGAINDGCDALGAAEWICNETACSDNDTSPGQPPWQNCDNDADGRINDGCWLVGGGPETPAQCWNNTDDDEASGGESAGQCENSIDDDGDTKVNDGCPQVGDGYVNDGCPQVNYISESGTQCTNNLDDDGDPDCDGVANADDNCPNAYNPTQLNTDMFAVGKGDSQGDACDPDDDQDKTLDVDEWAISSNPKNVCDPANFDLNNAGAAEGVITISDVVMFSNAILGSPCNPPVNYAVCEPIYRGP